MINRFLGKKEEEKRSSLPIVDPELVEALFNEDDDVQSDDEFEDMPVMRRVIEAPMIKEALFPEEASGVLVKAQPSLKGDQCVFMVNRSLLKNKSWYFGDALSAKESSLAEAVFEVQGVESVLVYDATVIVTPEEKYDVEWRPLATDIGARIRGVVEAGAPVLSEGILSSIPSEEFIREEIQKVIDEVVNPGVAGHGGHISLLGVKGNSITIQMGGGCQGCSVADVTLKQGIHTSFRDAVPQVGAIFDETDHAAGLTPYFS